MKVTYGADPEFFVQEIKTGEIVPACGRFGGAKKAPIFLTPNGGYLEDGVAIELNVSPSSTLQELCNKLEELIIAWQVQFPEYLLVPGKSWHHFGDKLLRKFPQAMVLGCDADYWFYGIRNLPQAREMKGDRFTGGHLHIGVSGMPEGWTPEALIPFLDLGMLGHPHSFNMQDKRRWKFYGHPGLYRLTDYGIEYRSPDNWWATPKNHPLVSENSYATIQRTMEKWQKYLDLLFHAIENRPTWVWQRSQEIFTHLSLGDYLGSKKILLDKGFANRLPQYFDSFYKHVLV